MSSAAPELKNVAPEQIDWTKDPFNRSTMRLALRPGNQYLTPVEADRANQPLIGNDRDESHVHRIRNHFV